MRKRILACLLTAAMVFTSADFTVFATETAENETIAEQSVEAEESSNETETDQEKAESVESESVQWETMDESGEESAGSTHEEQVEEESTEKSTESTTKEFVEQETQEQTVEKETQGNSAEESMTETVSEEENSEGDTALVEEIVEVEDADNVGEDILTDSEVLTGQCGDNLTWTIEDGTLTISGTGEMWDYGTEDHYEIGAQTNVPWWEYKNIISGIVLEQGITKIGEYAFAGCSSFKGNLVIPDSVMSIGERAFSECSGLTGDLIIPGSVTSIGEGAFCLCSGLTGDLIIPNSVTFVGEYAFNQCSGLNGKLIISTKMTSIKAGTFMMCHGLTGDLIIPESITKIEDMAFWWCSSLTGNLIIPNSVTEIGEESFFNCVSLTGKLEISNSVTEIGDSAFDGCHGLTGDLIIPNSVKKIGGYAFGECSGLKGKLEISNNVTEIEYYAFSRCSGLTGDLIIPNSVTEIGCGAFWDCHGLTGDLLIPNSVKKISEYAFSGCSGLTGNLVIPNSVTIIEGEAFCGCFNFIGDLKIPNSVTSIGYSAFLGCASLSGKIYIPKSVISIGEDAFLGIPNPTIYGVKGSYAETYANANNIPFVEYEDTSTIRPNNSQIAINGNYANVYIIDAETSEPISDALVNGSVTNAKGHVLISVAEDGEEKTFSVSADGYNLDTFTKNLKPNSTCYLSLEPVEGALRIVKVSAIVAGKGKNLLTDKLFVKNEDKSVIESGTNDNLKIIVKARGDIKKYALIQSGTEIMASDNGEFLIPAISYKGNFPYVHFNSQDAIYVKVTDSNGNEVKKLLGLGIISKQVLDIPEEEKSGKVSLGSDLKITLPESVPFLGGKTSTFGLQEELPFEIEATDDGKIKIGINKKASVSMDKFKKEYERLSSKASNVSDAIAAFGGSSESFGAGCFDLKASVKGYGEGYLDMTNQGEFEVKVGIILAAKGSGKYTQYIFAGSIPFFFTIEGGGEAGGDVRLIVRCENSKVAVDFGIGSITGKVYLKVTAGVGVGKVLNINVAGTGETNMLWKPSKDYIKIWMSAFMEAKAEFFCWEMELWSSPKKTRVLYETQNAGMGSRSVDTMLAQLYNSNTYTIMDRGYLSKSKEYDMSASEVSGIVKDNVYPGASPKIVKVNDMFYLFWLQDIETRAAENRAAVVYATSNDGVSWSSPKQIVSEAENQTMDNSIDVYVEDNNIYVCWQDASEVYESGISLNDAVKKLNIAYAVIDGLTGNVVSNHIVTEQAGCYLQPTIYVKDGNVQLAWLENNILGDSIWSAENEEKLSIYDSVSGEISIFSTGTGKEKIISMDGAVGNNQKGVIYILDIDGDYTTIEDRKVYYDTRFGINGSQTPLTENAGLYTSPVVSGNNYYWGTGGNIAYATIGSSAVQYIYDEERADLGSEFHVISEGNKTQIIWNAIEYETEKVAFYGISSVEGGEWSKPCIIKQTDSEMTSVVSCTLKNEMPLIAYVNIKNETDGSKTYNLCITEEVSTTNISLNYAIYEYDQFEQGQVLPITIELANNGNTKVESIDVKLDGASIGTESVDLKVGETQVITLNNYIVPTDLNSYTEHTLSVSAISESDLSDNDYKIGIGYTDMNVLCTERLHNENMWFDISVLNDSSIASDAVLNIRADREDGEIVYTEQLGVIEGGKGISLTVDMKEYQDKYCTYFVEVVSGVEDVIEGNNVEFMYTGLGTDIKPGELIAEPVMYTVNFNTNGGSVVESQLIEENMSATEPEMPLKEYADFIGWYLGDVLYDFNTPITENIILIAKWQEYETLVSPSATIVSGSEVEKGTKISLTCAATGAKIYYTLDNTDPTIESILYIEPIEITSDITIKAIAVKEGFKNSDIATFTYTVKKTDEESKDDDGEDDSSHDTTEGVLPEDIPSTGIPNGLWIAGIDEAGYSYTGKAVKPQVRVYDSETRLVAGKDYTITYKNNTKANDASVTKKAPTVVVKGKGNYAGKETAVFKILPVDLNDVSIVADNITTAFNNKVQKKVPVVTFKGKKLSNKKDFTVSYPDLENGKMDAFKAAGTYDVIITAKQGGNFTGKRTVKLTITDSILISKASIKKVSNQTYTGKAIEPEITISYQKAPLVKGTDYTIAYENNVDIGTATAVITGIGKYAGTKKISFKITGEAMKNAAITGISNKVYNGEKQTQKLTVSLNGKTLKENTDFEAIYSNNMNVGKATVTIKGIGAYSGSVKKNFNITAYDLSQDSEKMLGGWNDSIQAKYVKGGSKPELSLTFGEAKLIAGRDYTITYKNNKAVTTSETAKKPVIIIKGKGNFKGTLSKEFTINPKAFDDADSPVTIHVPDMAFADKAGKYISKPVLTDTDGKKLTAGRDYEKEVLYTLEDGTVLDSQSKVQAGTNIKATVKGKGAYSGELTAVYRITKSSFNKAKIEISAQDYTGKEITLDKDDILVKIGSTTLTYGTDYEIVADSYSDNIKKGTAKVTIIGKGNYGGTKTVKFRIVPKQLSWFWRILG